VTKNILVCLIISGVLFTRGIAADKYYIADTYLKDGDYEKANKEYLNIIEAKGPATLSQDVRAMTGAFITYHMLQEFKKSFSFCKQVLKLQSYHSVAIFYAGKNLESLGNPKLAKKLYQYYAVLSPYDPYRSFIKARYDILLKQEAKQQIATAIQSEGRVGSSVIPDNSLAVIYFANESGYENWNALSKGLCQLLIDDFSQIKAIKVITRLELQVLIDELKFDQTQFNDENLLPRFGRLLKAKKIIGGSYNVDSNSKIHLNVLSLNLDQPNLAEQMEFSGDLKYIFKLEKNILDMTIKHFDIAVTTSEKREINKIKTNSMDAFLAFCEGLDVYDLGNYDAAFSQFTLATRFDSRFEQAKSFQLTMDAVLMINQGNYAMNHFKILKGSSYATAAGVMTSVSVSRSRLENISNNLDLGYLPGNESRNGAAGGLDISHIQLEQVKLPKPPLPPSN